MTDFQELQNAFHDIAPTLCIITLFDLLYLDGRDLTRVPLEERKRLLAGVLNGKGVSPAFTIPITSKGDGPAFFKKACEMGLEGIISKRRDRPYEPGRGYGWLKVKCMQHDEFVIGGFTEPTGSRVGFGALLLGYHDEKGELVYAGKVGTGFDDRMLSDSSEAASGPGTESSPFSDRKRVTRAASIGSIRSSWPRLRLAPGRGTDACVIRRSRDCARTNLPPR